MGSESPKNKGAKRQSLPFSALGTFEYIQTKQGSYRSRTYPATNDFRIGNLAYKSHPRRRFMEKP